MRLVLTGHDDVFGAAAAIEQGAVEAGIAVTRVDRPVPDIDYSLEDLLCFRRSDLELAVDDDDPALAARLAAVRAAFPGVTFTVA